MDGDGCLSDILSVGQTMRGYLERGYPDKPRCLKDRREAEAGEKSQ